MAYIGGCLNCTPPQKNGGGSDLGFFSIPTEPLPAIILVESAIDAISCFALHPHHRCISTAGARPNPRWLAACLDQGSALYCGFDADRTGEAMARDDGPPPGLPTSPSTSPRLE